MPRYRPETAKAKAKKLAKAYSKAGFNQTRLAEKEGVTSQAINQRLKKAPVQRTLEEYLDKAFPKSYIQNKFKEGLEGNKVVGYLNNKVEGTQKVSDEFIEVPDLHCRHKYLVTLLEVQKIIKHNGNGHTGTGNVIIQIIRPAPDESPDTSPRIHIKRALLAEENQGR